MTVLQHLIRKIEHSNINLDAQEFTDVSQIIKKVRIPALEMNRDNITMCLHALHYKGLFPIQVTDYSILTTRTQPAGNIIN